MTNILLPLIPAPLKPYAKAVVAVLGAVATIAVYYFGDAPQVAALVPVLTALGVLAQPNGKPTREDLVESVEDAASEVRDALRRR